MHRRRQYLMSLITRICEARLRDCLPILCIVILAFNIFGYFFGFVGYREKPNDETPTITSNSPNSLFANIATTRRSRTRWRSSYFNSMPVTPTPQPLLFATSTVTWKPPAVPCHVTSRMGRRKDYGRWYDYGVSPFQFYAYSALWDDRQSLGQPGVIRLIAISSTRNTGALRIMQAHSTEIEMHCRLYYSDGQSVVVPMNTYAHPVGYGWWVNGELVREYIFTCSPSSDLNFKLEDVPVALEVLLGNPSWSHSVTDPCMPVELPDKPAVKRDLAACVMVTYGTLNALRLIEWFELQRLLGIEFIGIYNMSIANTVNTRRVLEHYTQTTTGNGDEPLVELRRSDYIQNGKDQYLLHATPVVNDCIYRNMFRFKRIAVIDLDELIIPQEKDIFDLRQLVTKIDSMFSVIPNAPVNFIFANNYFFLDGVPATRSATTLAGVRTSDLNVLLSSELTVLKYLTRVPVSPPGYSVKSIIDPQACLHMHNHFCWGNTPQFVGRNKFTIIDHSLALNHHYKYCHFVKSECDDLLSRLTVNDVMLKYRDKLSATVAGKIRTIFGDSASVVGQLLPL